MGSGLVLAAESVREQALLATAEIWAEAGYESITLESVCHRAEIDADELGAELPDRESLARSTFEIPVAAVVKVVAAQYGPDRPEAESCAMGIVRILELMAANPAYAFVLYVGRRQAAIAPGVTTVSRTAQRLMVAMLERLGEGSDVGRPVLSAGAGALGSAEALIRREISAWRYERLPQLAPDIVYGAVTPFRGQAEGIRLAELSKGIVEAE